MPPNVTLQRSASVPDSQLSPGYKPLSPSQQQQQQRQPQQQFNSFNAGLVKIFANIVCEFCLILLWFAETLVGSK